MRFSCLSYPPPPLPSKKKQHDGFKKDFVQVLSNTETRKICSTKGTASLKCVGIGASVVQIQLFQTRNRYLSVEYSPIVPFRYLWVNKNKERIVKKDALT